MGVSAMDFIRTSQVLALALSANPNPSIGECEKQGYRVLVAGYMGRSSESFRRAVF